MGGMAFRVTQKGSFLRFVVHKIQLGYAYSTSKLPSCEKVEGAINK